MPAPAPAPAPHLSFRRGGCRYLYKSNSPGVQDYLCNRLYTLPERDVERYLSQLTQLCIQRPSSSLERVLLDLCGQSLRIAVKVGAGRHTLVDVPPPALCFVRRCCCCCASDGSPGAL